jgi:hypothetical protein
MTEAPDCRSAQAALQRAVTGASVSEEELERALAHIAACEDCGAGVDIGPTAACEEVKDDLPAAAPLVREGEDLSSRLPDLAHHLETCERCRAILADLSIESREASEVAEPEVQPGELFEQALRAALTEPDAIARRRAAERLGSFERLGPAALSALAETALEDPDEAVRAAALEALDRLDDAISISRRVIEAWAEAPAEAAPFIAGVLARLAGAESRAGAGVTGLSASGAGEEGVSLAGGEGIGGQVTREEDGLWLTLDSLPSTFEKKMPVVAVPLALRIDAPAIRWSGERPGLVPASTPVSEGRLRVRLGDHAEAPSGETFERVYLLDTEAEKPPPG